MKNKPKCQVKVNHDNLSEVSSYWRCVVQVETEVEVSQEKSIGTS